MWGLAVVTQKIKKAVIPAAGIGSRFFPLTRAQPKEMLPILDKPVIHYVVEEALKSGLEEILIIVGHGKDSIIDYFDRHPPDVSESGNEIERFPPIYFVRQKEPKGLADSISYAETFTGSDPFVVLLGDTIYQSNDDETVTLSILNAYEKWRKQIVLIEKVPQLKIGDYGIIEGKRINEDTWNISDVIEKPDPRLAPSNMGLTGTYILHREIYDIISALKPGKNGEYQLSDALGEIAKSGNLMGKEIRGTRYDIGTKELWVQTFVKFAKSDPRFSDFH